MYREHRPYWAIDSVAASVREAAETHAKWWALSRGFWYMLSAPGHGVVSYAVMPLNLGVVKSSLVARTPGNILILVGEAPWWPSRSLAAQAPRFRD